MTMIGKIRRVNFKKVKYGKGLDDLLPRSTNNPQPEENIITQKTVSMIAEIKDVEVNYYSKSITMDSDSGAIIIENICTACISHSTEDFVG